MPVKASKGQGYTGIPLKDDPAKLAGACSLKIKMAALVVAAFFYAG